MHISCLPAPVRGNIRRWFLINQFREYWTGEDFTPHKDFAMLYASLNEAKEVANTIMLQYHKQKKLTRYIAPVVVDLRCDEKLSVQEVSEWLIKHSRFILDIPIESDEGPLEGSYSTLVIKWSELEELEERSTL